MEPRKSMNSAIKKLNKTTKQSGDEIRNLIVSLYYN